MALRMQREYDISPGELGSDDLSDAIQDVSRSLLRVQKALRLQKQEVGLALEEALRLQEQRAAAALQERDLTIRALRQELDVRMQAIEGRVNAVEEQLRLSQGKNDREEGARQGSIERLETNMVKLEVSPQSALGTVFPRVDALVSELEKRLPIRAPCGPPSASALPFAPTRPCASSTCSDGGSSHPRLPTSSARGVATLKEEAAGARKDPSSSREHATACKEEHERQRVEIRLRQASAKIDRALAALGLV